MKMKAEHYDELVAMLDKFNDKVKDCEKEMTGACNDFGHVQEAYAGQGLSLERFRWDVLFAIPFEERRDWFKKVYEYANDDHVDTALRKYFGHEK